MKTVIVAVFDVPAKAFAMPAFVPSVGYAVRSFTGEVNRKDDKNVMYTNSSDFLLYELGTYDEVTGRIEMLPDIKLVSSGKNVRV